MLYEVCYYNETAMPLSHRSDDEAKFLPSELFFSRTDSRGVIRSGNSVFQRISGYDWSKLIGAPHKIIRHSDMPKGVFRLFWDTIQRGDPIGAYVKNREKDGRFYWVFAIVTPIEDGYLSVRIKPTSPLFERIVQEYASLREAETSGSLTPEESAQKLLKRITELGFSDYPSFMAHAISLEMKSRNEILDCSNGHLAQHFDTMLAAVATIQEEGGRIVSEFELIRTTPLNMRIQAAHLGARAAPLSVIAENYTSLADEIHGDIEAFLATCAGVVKAMQNGLFLICICELQKEAIAQFDSEQHTPDIFVKADEVTLLRDQNARYSAEASVSLKNIIDDVSSFNDVCETLKRTLSGLSLTRVICQIETARIGDDVEGMSEIIAQLGVFQALARECLRTIERESLSVRKSLRQQIADGRSGHLSLVAV